MRYIFFAFILAAVSHYFVPRHAATDVSGQVLPDVDGIGHIAADLRFAELQHAHDVVFAGQASE